MPISSWSRVTYRYIHAITTVGVLLYGAHAVAQDESTPPELKLTISCPDVEYKVGDEIPITFTITNIGDTPYEFWTGTYDRSGRMPEYQLTAKDEDGNPLADPRAGWPGGPGGGLGGMKELAKGESGEMTIALNRWCVITEPGSYTVTGTFAGMLVRHDPVASPSITVTVDPRTPNEMAEYIESIRAECERMGPQPTRMQMVVNPRPQGSRGGRGRAYSESDDELERLVQRLMYTHDPAIAPLLIDLWYEWPDASFWISEAFVFYLPRSPDMLSAIRDAALNRGLQPSMIYTLRKIGPTDADYSDIVARALASDDANEAVEGARCAATYWRDEFVGPLVAIALDEKIHEIGRMPAIDALGQHPTSKGDDALESLLEDSNERIQDAVKRALENR